jgi:hypothetical protein
MTTCLQYPMYSVIRKCFTLCNELDNDYASMAENIMLYLQMTRSELKNSNRKKNNAFNLWRHQKVQLRNSIAKHFYPDSIVSCQYTQGTTFIEKICKGKHNEVFSENAPQEQDIHFFVFLLLDNIYIPSEINCLMKILQESYIYRHSKSSETHNIQHTLIWNSTRVFQDIIDFIFITTTLMKCVNVQDYCCEKNHYANIDTTLRQKISHGCHQYALFIAMQLIQEVGLYPDMDNITWQVNGASFHDYNIFGLLIALFQSVERDSSNRKPIDHYIDVVIMDFISFCN